MSGKQTWQLIRILLNPRVTVGPLTVLRRLRRKGVRRMPDALLADLDRRTPTPRLLRFIRRWLDGEILSRHRGQWVLNSFIPPFPGPAYMRLFENLESGRRVSPVSAFLGVTSECPYNCWHCSARRDGAAEDLDTGHWLTTIGQLRDLGVSIIGFTGGEPLLRPDLPDLVAAATQAGCATIVFSSGAGGDAARVRALREAGLWAFCVSIDAADPGEHDRLRGHDGAFERARAAVQASCDAGLYTMLSSVGTRRFVASRTHEAVYQLARDWGCQEYRIVEPMPCGALTGKDDDLLETTHIAVLRQFHVETNRRQRLPKVCAFNQVESPEVFGCGAGTQHLYIDAAGRVCPCDFTPLNFGTVTEEPLVAIWNRMNSAMGELPRRHCFIQTHHRLIRAHADRGPYPLAVEDSLAVCADAGHEPLPDYFAMVMGERPGEEPGCRTDR